MASKLLLCRVMRRGWWRRRRGLEEGFVFHEVELLRSLTDVPGENLVIVHDVMMTVDDVTLFIWDHFTGKGVELGNALHRIEAVVAMVAGAGTRGLGCRA